MINKKVILAILDGWGLGKNKKSDAIQNANTPFINNLFKNYSNSTLITYGSLVGLPEGQMGNSEVGHLNLGAGRIVYQELQRINVAIETNELNQNKPFQDAINYAKTNNKPFHLLGLVSDGGVHSHINHLIYLLEILKKNELKEVYIHAITDGRDTDPKSGLKFITQLQNIVDKLNYKIASISGRYYAMDRDKRWERVKLAYDCLINGNGEFANTAIEAINLNYTKNITDEFIKPTIIKNNTDNTKLIKKDDVVLCFNFRTDRCREITEVLTQNEFIDFNMKPINLYYLTMTDYDKSFKNIKVIFETDNLKNTLGEVLEKNNKTQIRIAETEKYPHVTFFFSGGRENPFEGEKRLLVPSPKVATYDLQPEMSANEITDKLLPEIEKATTDFICLNFANTDMVGHTGVFSAAIKAAETVDNCLEKIITKAIDKDYTIIVIADHGNADYMINDDGTPNTAHTTNLVPIILVDKNKKYIIKNGKLGDVAPTILKIMDLDIPKEMTGNVIIE